jgi:hypothetical protein
MTLAKRQVCPLVWRIRWWWQNPNIRRAISGICIASHSVPTQVDQRNWYLWLEQKKKAKPKQCNTSNTVCCVIHWVCRWVVLCSWLVQHVLCSSSSRCGCDKCVSIVRSRELYSPHWWSSLSSENVSNIITHCGECMLYHTKREREIGSTHTTNLNQPLHKTVSQQQSSSNLQVIVPPQTVLVFETMLDGAVWSQMQHTMPQLQLRATLVWLLFGATTSPSNTATVGNVVLDCALSDYTHQTTEWCFFTERECKLALFPPSPFKQFSPQSMPLLTLIPYASLLECATLSSEDRRPVFLSFWTKRSHPLTDIGLLLLRFIHCQSLQFIFHSGYRTLKFFQSGFGCLGPIPSGKA